MVSASNYLFMSAEFPKVSLSPPKSAVNFRT